MYGMYEVWNSLFLLMYDQACSICTSSYVYVCSGTKFIPHTYIHACMHTLHTYMHTHTYIHTYIHTHTYMHTQTHTYTYIHTLHAYIYTCSGKKLNSFNDLPLRIQDYVNKRAPQYRTAPRDPQSMSRPNDTSFKVWKALILKVSVNVYVCVQTIVHVTSQWHIIQGVEGSGTQGKSICTCVCMNVGMSQTSVHVTTQWHIAQGVEDSGTQGEHTCVCMRVCMPQSLVHITT
jgi:hypothetical protein